jgi:hypothetical protein
MSTSESLGVSPAPVASVPVGKYGLEVGSPDGAFALFQPTPEEVNAQALAAALRARSGQVREAAEADVERIVDEASAVTARSEKCVRLFNELAEGKALDPKVVSAELDAMLVRGFKTPVRLEKCAFLGMNQSFESPHARRTSLLQRRRDR